MWREFRGSWGVCGIYALQLTVRTLASFRRKPNGSAVSEKALMEWVEPMKCCRRNVHVFSFPLHNSTLTLKISTAVKNATFWHWPTRLNTTTSGGHATQHTRVAVSVNLPLAVRGCHQQTSCLHQDPCTLWRQKHFHSSLHFSQARFLNPQ